jgi:hypothetical protein
MNKRNIIIGVTVVALAIAWYTFRPELLFVNKTVSEEFPGGPAMASIEKGPIAVTKGNFKGLAHETKGLRRSISSPTASGHYVRANLRLPMVPTSMSIWSRPRWKKATTQPKRRASSISVL